MNNQPLELSILDYEETMLQVKQGAALLDEVYPKWERAVSIGQLYLESAGSCVLGQLAPEYTGGEFADYFSMLSKLVDEGHIEDVNDDTAIQHGFCLVDEHDGDYLPRDHTRTAWNELTQVWKTFITDRRGY